MPHANHRKGLHSQKHLKCDKVVGHNQCVPCERLGRPCTFTHEPGLLNNLALVAASINPAIDKRVERVKDRLLLEY